ncbi:MAG: NVEALA domain-containing protein [Prevotellaceae bacterium]|jgi:hypothetical protein|nr:NVEALA domain-containing protein [Prevotellaceae bacterium]
MRKKLIIAASVVAIGAIAAFNVSMNSQSDNLSDLALANVEALAGEKDYPRIWCPYGRVLCATVEAPHGTFKYYKPS